MSDLVAKAVLKADASGLVLAADQSDAALRKVQSAANDLGKAAAGATAPIDASASALEAQRQAAEAATRAAGATGQQHKQESTDLKAVSAARENDIAKMQALAGAYAEYNSGLSASKALLDANLITGKDHNANIEGLAAKLALAKKAFAETGSSAAQAEVDMAAVERMMGSLGVQAGISGGQIKVLREGLKAIPELIGAFPVTSGFAAIAVAAGIALAAHEAFAASVNRLNVTLAAHGLVVMGTSGDYLKLANDVAAAGGVTEKTGRQMAGAFADAGLSPQIWAKASAVAADYAAVLGTDVPQAAAQMADSLRNPTEAAKQLNERYGLFDGATMKLIERLDQVGARESAQTIILDTLGARIENAAKQTTGWALAWKSVSTAASSAWDAIGNALFKGELETAKLEMAKYAQEMADAKNGTSRRMSDTSELAAPRRSVAAIQADIDRVQDHINKLTIQPALDEARNKESAWLADLGKRYDEFGVRMDANLGDRVRILKGRSQGLIDEATATKYLTANTREYKLILKEQHEAQLALNDAARYWEQRVKSLIESGPEAIAQARLDAEAAKGQSGAYLQGASALDDFNAKQDVLKATLPQVTALEHASAYQKRLLTKQIEDLTNAEEKRHAALRLTATLQNIDQRLVGANDNTDRTLTDASFDEKKKRLTEVHDNQIKDLVRSGLPIEDIDSYVAKVELLFRHDLKNLYLENLRDHTDWASGIERANIDLTNSLQDFAAQSEAAVKGWASAAQQQFEEFAASGKFSVGSLVDFVTQQFARMAYLRWMAPSINAVGSGIFGAVDQAFGFIDRTTAGVHHTGGAVGYASISRSVPAAFFAGAARYHLGGTVGANDNLKPGEVPIIAQVGERVQTAAEQRSDMLRDEALVAALQRPAVLQLPSGTTGGGSVKIAVFNPPGTTTKQTVTTDAQGNQNIDIVNELAAQVEQKMAADISDGRSMVAAALEQRFGLKRGVA